MGASVPATSAVTPQQKLSGIRATENKGAVHPKEPESPLRVIAQDTVKLMGKQSNAATEIGLSEGRVSAKFGDGSIQIKELEQLGVEYAVRFAEEIIRQLAPLATPQARARQTLRRMRQELDELDQYLEHVS